MIYLIYTALGWPRITIHQFNDMESLQSYLRAFPPAQYVIIKGEYIDAKL